jgi:predicted negative regulator of RcsB-dependent stress response
VLYEAELHRLKGKSLIELGHPDEAKECFAEALKIARQQGAKLFQQRLAKE